jgi:hypothetical protein
MCVQCLGSSPLKLDACSMASCKGINSQSFKEYVEGRGIDYGSESVWEGFEFVLGGEK